MQSSKRFIVLQSARLVLKSLRWFVLFFVYGLLTYALFALVSAVIPVAAEELPDGEIPSHDVYLLKSGPHTDFLVRVKSSIHDWSLDFPYANNEQPDTALPWLAIGWGDKGFYLNTPTWGDLTCKTAVSAAAGLGTAGIHASYYFDLPNDRPMAHVKLTDKQYSRLCDYISKSLVADANGRRVLLHSLKQGINFGHDRYYDAYGKYSMIHTCNTWVNNGLKACGQRACCGPDSPKVYSITMKNKILFALYLYCGVAVHAQNRYLIFSNGYRGMHLDSITTTNDVFSKSPAGGMSPDGYWFDMDDTLIARFRPTATYYIDGHHPVATSTHRTLGKSYWSWVVTRFGWLGRSNWGFNDEPNPVGFQCRFDNGVLCGQRFLNERKLDGDTLDIVCHSMGYAYALGFMKALEPHVVWGKMLIMAPESPDVMGYDWNRFEEVWQYGSDRFEKGALVTCRQDGIAPQCAVLGIEQLQPGKGGRLFIPKGAKLGFVRSHHLSYWDWFYWIKKGDRGWFGRY